MKHSAYKRRKLVKTLLAMPFLTILPANAAVKTPRTSEGPFYPLDSMRYADNDNDLVKIANVVKQAGGEILHLSGRVLDIQNKPIKNARVEIWQCDANGRYLHTSDKSSTPLDNAFQGIGHTISDHNGVYNFRTIKPVSYPGRTPHIHVKTFANGRELTTQFYLAEHVANNHDFLFNDLSKPQQKAVSMTLQTHKEGFKTSVDIIM